MFHLCPSVAKKSAPLLGLHLLFRQAEIVDDEMLGEIHERVRAAGVEDGVGQIRGDFLDPFRRNAASAASPVVFRRSACAGDEEFEIRILRFELAELGVEDMQHGATTKMPAAVPVSQPTRLFGRGCGLVDLSLLASALLSEQTLLWTLDQRLDAVATELARAYRPALAS